MIIIYIYIYWGYPSLPGPVLDDDVRLQALFKNSDLLVY